MSRSALYLNFSYKYKLLVKNELNDDIKRIIWKIYLQLVMKEKIQQFIKKNIFRCRDCHRADWAFLGGYNQNFYCVGACNLSNIYFTDMPCCIKYICLKNRCRFRCKCSECKTENNIRLPNNINDIGYNPVEGIKTFNFECYNCGKLNVHKLVWNDKCSDSTVLGKLV